MGVLERLAGLRPRALYERLAADPPHRLLLRAARVARRSGLLRGTGHAPLALARVVLEQGLSLRSVHAIHAASSPGRPALVDGHRTLDYASLHAEIDAVAHVLHQQGARRGQPVGLLLENRSEYVASWMALVRLGVPTAHLGTSTTAAELQPLLRRSGIELLVASDATWPVVEQLRALDPGAAPRVVHVGHAPPPATVGYHAGVASNRGHGPPPAPREREAASVVFTSGTTGQPKGAVRDFASLGAMELMRVLDRLPLRAGDRHLVVAPLYHSGAQAFTVLHASLGATVTLMDRFDAAAVLDRLSLDRIHSVFLVPTMLRRILDLPAEHHARRPTPALRAIVSGAAPFPEALRRRAIERFGADVIYDFYGATELGWVTLASGHDMLERPGTLGRPLAGQEIRVVDDRGRSLPPGEVGEVQTRSAQHMRGYLGDPAATEEIRRGGWVTVEDLGVLDDAGHLYLTGRARDMVISGGVNVYPVEVESALSRCPGVSDVAVLGVPDPEWGERLVAVVVPDEGFDVAVADAWAREHLAHAKVPRRWELVDVLPRNPTGKVLKRELEQRFGPGADSG